MKVPTKVVFFARPPRTVELFDGTKVTIRDTYPAYPESKARMTSGKKWAEDRPWNYKPKKNAPEEECHQVEFDNKFHGLTIQSLEVRGEGGRAYKTIVNGYLFDLRESTLLDIFAHVGIQKGGHVDDEFCFVGEGAEFKLVRFGSDQHQEMLALDAKYAVKHTEEYVFGHCYENQTKGTSIYLGEVLVDKVEFRIKPAYANHEIGRGSWYGGGRIYEPAQGSADAKYYDIVLTPNTKPDRLQLWYNDDNLKDLHYFYFQLVKSTKRLPTNQVIDYEKYPDTAAVLTAFRAKRLDKNHLDLHSYRLRLAEAAPAKEPKKTTK